MRIAPFVDGFFNHSYNNGDDDDENDDRCAGGNYDDSQGNRPFQNCAASGREFEILTNRLTDNICHLSKFDQVLE